MGASKERLKLDRVQFLQCSQGLRRHSGGKKPENDVVLVMLCLWGYCFLKKPVWSGLSGKAKESLSSSHAVSFQSGASEEPVLGVNYLWGFTIESRGQQESYLRDHTSPPCTARHSHPPCRQSPLGLPEGTCTPSALKPRHTLHLIENELPLQTTPTLLPSTPTPTRQQALPLRTFPHNLMQASAEVLRRPRESQRIWKHFQPRRAEHESQVFMAVRARQGFFTGMGITWGPGQSAASGWAHWVGP